MKIENDNRIKNLNRGMLNCRIVDSVLKFSDDNTFVLFRR